MIIKLACECGSTFTITERITDNGSGCIICPCCDHALPSSVLGDLRAIFKKYSELCEDLKDSGVSVKSLKLSKKQETSEG